VGTRALSRRVRRQELETDQIEIVFRLLIQNSVVTLIPPVWGWDSLVVTRAFVIFL
jgi:hypothetical protein